MIIGKGDMTKTYKVGDCKHLRVKLISGCINIVFVNPQDLRIIKTCNDLGTCFDEDISRYTYFTFESVEESEISFELI